MKKANSEKPASALVGVLKVLAARWFVAERASEPDDGVVAVADDAVLVEGR